MTNCNEFVRLIMKIEHPSWILQLLFKIGNIIGDTIINKTINNTRNGNLIWW